MVIDIDFKPQHIHQDTIHILLKIRQLNNYEYYLMESTMFYRLREQIVVNINYTITLDNHLSHNIDIEK